MKDLISKAKSVSRMVVKQHPEIMAVVAYGSVGRGYADKHSDIDLMFFCTRRPIQKKREKFWKKRAKIIAIFENVEAVIYKGKEYTIWYQPVPDVLRVLSDSLSRWISERKEAEIASQIQDIKIIWDPYKLIKNWKILSRKAFDNVARMRFKNIIIGIRAFDEIKKGLERRNFYLIDDAVDESISNFVHILYILNSLYFSTPKWFYKDVKKFKIKPRNCYNRFLKINSLDNREELQEKLRLLSDTWLETIRIVRKQYPDFKLYKDEKWLKKQVLKINTILKDYKW